MVKGMRDAERIPNVTTGVYWPWRDPNCLDRAKMTGKG